MCLIVDKNYPKQEDGAVRYKILDRCIVKDGDTDFYSVYYNQKWKLGVAVKKTLVVKLLNENDINGDGFHVYSDIQAASNLKRNIFENDYNRLSIVKCICKDFVAGGIQGGTTYLSEIWREVTPVEVIPWDKIP